MAELPHPKMLKIAEKLLERSQWGEMAWHKTIEENEFMIPSPRYLLLIKQLTFQPPAQDSNVFTEVFRSMARAMGHMFYRLSLTDERGTVIESLQLSPGGDGYKTLESLYHLARRRALQVDDRLDEVLRDLDQEGPVG